MKRLVDILIVLAFLPLWLPVMLLTAGAVRLSGLSPAIFRQVRVGLGDRPFTLLKFRTMRDGPGSDAERTTRLGRLLRATSLDELPQLFLVLSGKMSLVGPRPLPVAYLPRYTPAQRRRHEVLPGITGWAQVNGRNALSWERKFELDVWYVDHRSLPLDAKILFLTAVKVLRRSGIDHRAGETMPEFLGRQSDRNPRPDNSPH